MNYLLPTEYEQFGLETATPEAWTSAATSLINAHCRRTTLFIAQYVERIRLADHRYTLRLTYLPLAPVAPATNAITAAAVNAPCVSITPFGSPVDPDV